MLTAVTEQPRENQDLCPLTGHDDTQDSCYGDITISYHQREIRPMKELNSKQLPEPEANGCLRNLEKTTNFSLVIEQHI